MACLPASLGHCTAANCPTDLAVLGMCDTNPSAAPVCESTNLFVNYLPLDTDEAAVAKLFEPFGQVLSVKVMRHLDSGRSKGYGFVLMACAEDAEKAVQALQGKQLESKRLAVKVADNHVLAPQVGRTENTHRARRQRRQQQQEVHQRRTNEPSDSVSDTSTLPAHTQPAEPPQEPEGGTKVAVLRQREHFFSSVLLQQQLQHQKFASAMTTCRQALTQCGAGSAPAGWVPEPVKPAAQSEQCGAECGAECGSTPGPVQRGSAVYVKNLPLAWPSSAVATFFQRYGRVTRVWMMGAGSGSAPGIAVVSFAEEQAACTASYAVHGTVPPMAKMPLYVQPTRCSDARAAPSVRVRYENRAAAPPPMPQDHGVAQQRRDQRTPPTTYAAPYAQPPQQAQLPQAPPAPVAPVQAQHYQDPAMAYPPPSPNTAAPYAAPMPYHPSEYHGPVSTLPHASCEVEHYGVDGANDPYAAGEHTGCPYCTHGTSVLLHAMPTEEKQCERQLQRLLSEFGHVSYFECWGDGQAVATFSDPRSASTAVELLQHTENMVGFFNCRSL